VYRMLKVENEVERENKNQTLNSNSNVVSSEKHINKACGDGRPKPPSTSVVHAAKSTSRGSSRASVNHLRASSGISSASQERNADIATKTAAVKPTTGAKKPTVRYKPAHHSAPFKTTPLPPGQSKLPPVSRPGSRRTSAASVRASQTVEAKGINRHGGKISSDGLPASQASSARKIVHNEGRKSVTSSASPAPNSLHFSGYRNIMCSSVASEADASDSQTTDDCRTGSSVGADHYLQAEQICYRGIPSTSVIPSDDVIRLVEYDAGQTVKPQRSGGGRTCVAASAVIGQQEDSAFAGGMTANDVSRRTEAVDQSATVVQREANPINSPQHVAENSTSSFILHRDG